MTNYFRDFRLTGKDNPYRWENFRRLIKKYFPKSEIDSVNKWRLEDDSRGRRSHEIHVFRTENSPEAIIYVRERVSGLPKRKEGKRDYWGRNLRTFTRIEIEEISGRGNLARILDSPEFKGPKKKSVGKK